MSPNDPRHGSEAGNEQHIRDGEQPCQACYMGKLKAARRRNKRKTMGHAYTHPVDQARERVLEWRSAGASLDEIAVHVSATAGPMSQSTIWAVAHGQRDRIYDRNARKILGAKGHPVTTAGITRRLQALAWMGWSVDQIAEASGVHADTISDARKRPQEFMAVRVKAALVDAYERLHMQSPKAAGRWERAGVTRVRNHALRNGWLPPLAWIEIDDQRECPEGWQYRPSERTEALAEMDERGDGISVACRALKTSREALEKWCQRNGMNEVYSRMVARENRWMEVAS